MIFLDFINLPQIQTNPRMVIFKFDILIAVTSTKRTDIFLFKSIDNTLIIH